MRRPAAARMQKVNDEGLSHQPQEPQNHHGQQGPNRRLGQVHGQVLESQQVSQDDDRQQEQQQTPQKPAHHWLIQIGGGRQVRQEPDQVGAAQEPGAPGQDAHQKKVFHEQPAGFGIIKQAGALQAQKTQGEVHQEKFQGAAVKSGDVRVQNQHSPRGLAGKKPLNPLDSQTQGPKGDQGGEN